MIISNNEEMEGTMQIVNSGLLVKGVSEIIEVEAKRQNGGSSAVFLGTYTASLLENILKGVS